MSRRPYIRPIKRGSWYLRQARYRVYMLREMTCLLVAVYCVLLLAGLAALAAEGPQRWQAFLAAQQNTAWVVFHAIALVYFVVYQTMAWFQLAPKAMPLQLGGTRVPAAAIVAAHYLTWFIITILVFWMTGVI